MAPQSETTKARAHWQPLLWHGRAPRPFWVWHSVKRMAARGRDQSQSPITLPRPKPPEKGCYPTRRHSHRMRSCRSQPQRPANLLWRWGMWALSRRQRARLQVLGIPQAWHTLSVIVISVQGSPARLTMAFATTAHWNLLFSEAVLDRRRMAAGDRPDLQLIAARGPIQLLRRFNGESLHQRRFSEEGSSSLKRRNLCDAVRVKYQKGTEFIWAGSFFQNAVYSGLSASQIQ